MSLTLEIIEGINLLPMDKNGYSDPYVKIHYGKITVKTKTKKKTLNPTWGKSFLLPMAKRKSELLEIKVWDWDFLKKDDYLGGVSVDLEKLEFGKKYEKTLALKEVKHGKLRFAILLEKQTQKKGKKKVKKQKKSPKKNSKGDYVFDFKEFEVEAPVFDFVSVKVEKEKSKTLFFDKNFLADKTSVYKSDVSDIEIPSGAQMIKSWKRPHEYNSNHQLFVDGVEPGDVQQGSLGDCWFLGALSVIGTRQDILDHCICGVPTHPDQRGRYKFRFFKEGQWKTLEIDDRLPCNEKGDLIFARGADKNEMWVPLMEKAYAKLFGSYQQLTSSQTRDALVDMTGGVSISIAIDRNKVDKVKLWKRLKNFSDDGSYLMGCAADGGTESEMGDSGLLSGHAYSILNFVEVKGHKLINIRNPWGHTEWKGAWSDNSKEWTSEMKKALGIKGFGNDGDFWMNFDDFCYWWTSIDVVHIFNDKKSKNKKKWKCQVVKDEWTKETAGGLFGNPKHWKTRLTNPQYFLELEEDSEVCVSLTQRDYRYYGDDKDKNHVIGFMVLKQSEGYERIWNITNKDQVAMVPENWSAARENSAEGKLKKGKYVIIPSTLKPNIEDSFIMRVFSTKPFVLKRLPPLADGYSLLSHQGGYPKGSGGCGNTWRWINNDQFKLTLNCKSPDAEKKDVNLFIVFESNDPKSKIKCEVIKPGGSKGKLLELNKFEPEEKVFYTPTQQFIRKLVLNKSAGKGDVVLIPTTFLPNKKITYELKVYYSKVHYSQSEFQITMKQLSDSKNLKAFKNAWKKNNAGGSSNNRSYWLKNPRFTITVKGSPLKNVGITCVQKCESSESLFPVAIHVLKGVKPEEYDLLKKTEYEYRFLTSLNIESLDVGQYTVIPSTFKPNSLGSFQMLFNADSQINVN